MPEKAKVDHKRPSSRGLGYLTVFLLIAAALIIGAAHNPLQEFLRQILSTPVPSPADTPPLTAYPIPVAKTSSTDEFGIEAVIREVTNVEVLTVTVADNIRVEYLLVPGEKSRVVDVHGKNMLSMICAIRQVGPTRRPIIFAGVGRFVDESGETVLRSRVETKLSTLPFNLMECSSDIVSTAIDWNKVSDYHRTYANPEELIDGE